MSAEFKPMKPSEIAAFRVAAMTDSRHEDPRVRQMSVGLMRLVDSHEHYREEARRLRERTEAAFTEGRNVAPSADDDVAHEIEAWAAGVLGVPQ